MILFITESAFPHKSDVCHHDDKDDSGKDLRRKKNGKYFSVYKNKCDSMEIGSDARLDTFSRSAL